MLLAHNRYRLPGGEERNVDGLEAALTDAGMEVRRHERDSATLDDSPLQRVLAGLALTYRPGAGGIRSALRDWQPSVVHFHNIWPLLTPSALRAASQSGAAVVLNVQNYRFACPGGTLLRSGEIHEDCIEGSSLLCGLRNPRSSRLEGVAYGIALELQRRLRMLDRWVDAFIAPSEFMRQMLVRAGLPPARIHVIPNSVPLTDQPQASERKYVLFFGRLVPEKGVRTLLEASRLLPDVPIVFAGDGPLAAEVSGAGGRTRYLGVLDPGGVTEALRQAAFTVVPSEWYEPLGRTAVESFEAGRAVVATRMGGLPEVVDNESTGLLVEPRAPAALAGAIERLWSDPRRAAEMGNQARATAEERFSRNEQTARLLQIYADAGAQR